MGSHVRTYLDSKTRDGRIVSTFRDGFNILFDEVEEPGYVVFQTSDVPMHPWGIQLDQSYRPTLSFSEAQVARSGGGLIQIEEIVISIRETTVEALRIPTWTPEQLLIARQRVPIIRTALAKTVRQELHRLQSDGLPQILRFVLGQDLEEHVQRYVGLGGGSTPSGDDYLVGQLSVLWASCEQSPASKHQIDGFQTLLRWEELLTQTALPSAQMLLAASQGSFVDTIRDALRALSIESESSAIMAARRLASLGDSSGIAMLQGIFQALESMHPH